MIGNLSYINHKVVKNKECPVDLKTVEIINELYWRHFKSLINTTEFPVIEAKHIGLFYVNNGHLRKYVREMIRIIRRLRLSNEFKKGYGRAFEIEKEMVIKLRASWKQLDKLRYVYIARKERHQRKIEEAKGGNALANV